MMTSGIFCRSSLWLGIPTVALDSFLGSTQVTHPNAHSRVHRHPWLRGRNPMASSSISRVGNTSSFYHYVAKEFFFLVPVHCQSHSSKTPHYGRPRTVTGSLLTPHRLFQTVSFTLPSSCSARGSSSSNCRRGRPLWGGVERGGGSCSRGRRTRVNG